MSTLHLNIVLEVGKTYLDEKGDKVTLVREFTPEDADYIQGFRFRGDNKVNYLANGAVVGHLGGIQVVQAGAYGLKSEYVETVEETVVAKELDFALEEGKFYRNGLDQVVLIIGTTVAGSRWEKKGFRFMDHRGSFYTANGSVKSRLWSKIDLLREEKDLTTITDEEMVKIRQGVFRRVAAEDRADKIVKFATKVYTTCKKMMPYISAINVILGAARLRAGAKGGVLSMIVGLGGFAFDHIMPENIQDPLNI